MGQAMLPNQMDPMGMGMANPMGMVLRIFFKILVMRANFGDFGILV